MNVQEMIAIVMAEPEKTHYFHMTSTTWEDDREYVDDEGLVECTHRIAPEWRDGEWQQRGYVGVMTVHYGDWINDDLPIRHYYVDTGRDWNGNDIDDPRDHDDFIHVP